MYHSLVVHKKRRRLSEEEEVKRRLTITFSRAIAKVNSKPETIEVVLLALKGESSSTSDTTYLPPAERRKFTLRNEKEVVTFDVTPSEDPTFNEPLVYRIGWRRGYLGKMESHDFLMPDRDIAFEDLIKDGLDVPDTFYLREADIGVPGGVAGINEDGEVVNANGETYADRDLVVELLSIETSNRHREDIQIVESLRTSAREIEERVTSDTRRSISDSENRTTAKISEETRLREEAIRLLEERIGEFDASELEQIETLLRSKADLVDGVIPLSQLPEGVSANVIRIPNNESLAATVSKKGDFAVSPTDTWILVRSDYTVADNWVKIAALRSGIQSVNGKSGSTVVLTAEDVNARPVGPVPLSEVSGYDVDIATRLESYIEKNEQGGLDTSYLGKDIPRLDGTRIVNSDGEEVAVAGDVTSVNGEKGDVVITPESIGARGNGPITIADVENLQSNLNLKAQTNDPRFTDARKPTSHADTHKADGTDPLVLTQDQITNLVADLGAKASRQEFVDFKNQIETNLPDNPEQQASAAKEFASISLQAANTSTVKAGEASEDLETIQGLYENVQSATSNVEGQSREATESANSAATSLEQIQSIEASMTEKLNTATEKSNLAVSTSESTEQYLAAATALVSSLSESVEDPVLDTSTLDSIKQSVQDYLGKAYRDDAIKAAQDAQASQSITTENLERFETLVEQINARNDSVTVELTRLDRFKSDLDGFTGALATKVSEAVLTEGLSTKADKSHTHVSADVTDSTYTTGTASFANRLVKTHTNGHIYSSEDPVADNVLARKAYVDSAAVREALNYQPGGNVIPSGNSGQVWAQNIGQELDASYPGGRAYTNATQTPGNTVESWFPVVPGVPYFVSFWAKADKAGSRIYIEIRDQGGVHAVKSGTIGTGSGTYLVSQLELQTSWTQYTSIIYFTEAARRCRVGSFYCNHSSGTTQDAKQYFTDLHISPIGFDVTDFAGQNSTANGGKLVKTRVDGRIYIETNSVTNAGHAANKGYVDAQITTRAATSHSHTSSQISDGVNTIGGTQYANKVVKTGADGQVKLATANILQSTDLTNKDYVDKAVGAKANTSHTHAISDVDGLQAALNASAPVSHTHVSTDITDAVSVATVANAGKVVEVSSTGHIQDDTNPSAANDLTRKSYVDGRTPPISVVTSLPSNPNASTLYIVTG